MFAGVTRNAALHLCPRDEIAQGVVGDRTAGNRASVPPAGLCGVGGVYACKAHDPTVNLQGLPVQDPGRAGQPLRPIGRRGRRSGEQDSRCEGQAAQAVPCLRKRHVSILANRRVTIKSQPRHRGRAATVEARSGSGHNRARPGGVSVMEDHKIFGLDFNLLDAAALAVFFAGWIGYALFADFPGRESATLTAIMGEWRKHWAREMLLREMRMVDVQIISALLRVATFFAYTTILIIAGLSASLGATQQMMSLVEGLPFVYPASLTAWKVKILILILIFIFAFFKFTWCLRLHGYSSVLMGAAPAQRNGGPSPDAVAFADDIARISTRAAVHFNSGVRAYYFGLAAVSWFLHPYAVFAATIWVVLVLYRREFRSQAQVVLQHATRAGGFEGVD